MQICGFNKTTLLDYLGHVAATIFTCCCNFRCPFCQNGDLVLHPARLPQLDEAEVLKVLAKRRGILTGQANRLADCAGVSLPPGEYAAEGRAAMGKLGEESPRLAG